MDGSSEEKIQELRAATSGTKAHADEVLREAMRKKGGWTEEDIEFWLFPVLHQVLGALTQLSERLTNLEDVMLRAQLENGTPWSRLGEMAYQTDSDRQKMEAGITALNSERALIQTLFSGSTLVTVADRTNIGIELMRMLDRFVHQQNEFRQLRGEPLIPMRPQEE